MSVGPVTSLTLETGVGETIGWTLGPVGPITSLTLETGVGETIGVCGACHQPDSRNRCGRDNGEGLTSLTLETGVGETIGVCGACHQPDSRNRCGRDNWCLWGLSPA